MLRDWLDRPLTALSRFARTSRRRPIRRPRRLRSRFESLERREMMAYGVSFDAASGTLSIQGDDGQDFAVVEIAENNPNSPLDDQVVVTFNQQSYYFNQTTSFHPVKKIVFEGNGSHDIFINNTHLPCLAYGGEGDDRLEGGGGNDTLYGQGGNDYTLNGNGGHDFIDGGHGNDTIDGGDGSDSLYGGTGHDSIRGGLHDDFLYGSIGDDTLQGNAGHDKLFGDWGNDGLDGGEGNDTLFGGDNDDLLAGGDGFDLLRGDWGDDTLFGGAQADTLDGGFGRDGLYGGDGNDTCIGGYGDDRFLYQTGDTIQDLSSIDARIDFVNGGQKTLDGQTYAGQSWSQREIEALDEALAELHHSLPTTKLLKRHDGSRIVFIRQGDTAEGVKLAGYNDGNIYLGNDTVPKVFSDGAMQAYHFTVFHEIGHFWDNTFKNPYMGQFMALSGWTFSFSNPNPSLYMRAPLGSAYQTDLGWWFSKSAQFVSEYAMSSPAEDWADSFGHFFMRQMYGGAWGTTCQAKIDLIAEFVQSLK